VHCRFQFYTLQSQALVIILSWFRNLKRADDQTFVVRLASMDDEVGKDSDPDDTEQSSPRKKEQYDQRFRKDYNKYPGIVQCKRGSRYAYCEKCGCDFTISHGGQNDIVRHLKTKKHVSV
jgi:hypothetical protein